MDDRELYCSLCLIKKTANILFLIPWIFLFLNPGTYIAHNAPQLLKVQLEIQVLN